MEENRIPNTERPEEDIGELIKVRREKLRELQEAGKDPFREVRFEKTAMSRAIRENYPSYDGKTVSLAGRLVSKRVMGKASFAHLLDGEGQIQLYFKGLCGFQKIRYRRYNRRYGRRFYHAYGRNHRKRFVGETVVQVPAAPYKKISRTY